MKQEPKNESGGRGKGSVSFLSSPPPRSSFTGAIFRAGLKTLVPRSLLLNRTETLATQAKLGLSLNKSNNI